LIPATIDPRADDEAGAHDDGADRHAVAGALRTANDAPSRPGGAPQRQQRRREATAGRIRLSAARATPTKKVVMARAVPKSAA
jgi:hypothetical protein